MTPFPTPEEQKLIVLPESVIAAMLMAGRKQGHAPDSWMDEIEHHGLKAIGHLTSAERMRRGVTPEDAEGLIGHLERAVCRSVMALYCAKALAGKPTPRFSELMGTAMRDADEWAEENPREARCNAV